MSDVAQLQAAVDDEAVSTIYLTAEGSPYRLFNELEPRRNLTMIGLPGGDGGRVVLDAGSDAMLPRRVLRVAHNLTVNATALHLTGGRTSAARHPGGGVANYGTLFLTHCHVSNNWGYVGGGVFNNGTLVMTDCALYDNVAVLNGGGITNYAGHLTLHGCALYSNRALFGAGLVQMPLDGKSFTRLSDCHISGNHATERGGGILNYAVMHVAHSVISDNNASASSDVQTEHAIVPG